MAAKINKQVTPFEPTKRQELTKDEKLQRLAALAACPECGEKFRVVSNIEWDHSTPVALGGARKPDMPLCISCHKEKTREDVSRIRKADRQGGKKGQAAKRKKNGPQLKSRGFDKSQSKRMNGDVIFRD